MTWIKPVEASTRGRKIGLLGGSFNPAHDGHRYISEIAIKKLGLDSVWWLVSPQNPLKPSNGMASFDKRYANAVANYSHNRKIQILDIEQKLGTRFTIDTITQLQRRFPDICFVWLIGSDNLANFPRWKRWADIVARVPVAIILRPGSALAPGKSKLIQRFWRARSPDHAIKDLPCKKTSSIVVIDGPRSALSATRIREETGWGQAL